MECTNYSNPCLNKIRFAKTLFDSKDFKFRRYLSKLVKISISLVQSPPLFYNLWKANIFKIGYISFWARLDLFCNRNIAITNVPALRNNRITFQLRTILKVYIIVSVHAIAYVIFCLRGMRTNNLLYLMGPKI